MKPMTLVKLAVGCACTAVSAIVAYGVMPPGMRTSIQDQYLALSDAVTKHDGSGVNAQAFVSPNANGQPSGPVASMASGMKLDSINKSASAVQAVSQGNR